MTREQRKPPTQSARSGNGTRINDALESDLASGLTCGSNPIIGEFLDLGFGEEPSLFIFNPNCEADCDSAIAECLWEEVVTPTVPLLTEK